MHQRTPVLLFIVFILFPLLADAQLSIRGQVTSEQGEALIGATVAIPAMRKGVATDSDGQFQLNDLAAGQMQLLVSYVGYEPNTLEVTLPMSTALNVVLSEQAQMLKDIIVTGTWAGENTPVAYENVSKDELTAENLGQDVPFLLRWTPSVVVTSDAGTGIGYTGMRIRGTDPSRINVTINGIPLNDAESQSVFWVDLPDFAGSTESVQIQRGVGTSTNGSGAFGGTINLSSNTLESKPYAEVFNTYGSFNSHKHSLKAGSGLINEHWSFDTRLTKTQSDGYIDRASADLSSIYLAGGYYGEKTVLKGIFFTGNEVTYQSWFGTPESRLQNDEEGMRAHASREGYSEAQLENLLNAGRTYNFYLYDNQVDDYGQDHYQLHFSHTPKLGSTFNAALHYTRGSGFFEQFKGDDDFSNYQLANTIIGNDTIASGDFIRRRWLQNDYLGYTANWQGNFSKLDLTFGHAYHYYKGDHFGRVIWGEYAVDFEPGYQYYFNQGKKHDLNFFGKAEWRPTDNLHAFLDLQYREVNYEVVGIDADLRQLNDAVNYGFFNPKVGLSYSLSKKSRAYASLGVAQREPNRGDIIDRLPETEVKPEKMLDFELGYERQFESFSLGINLYNMAYSDQLVPTGALNDVGTPIRVNVADSYRRGVEMQAEWSISDQLSWGANLTLSDNRIADFEEIIYDYTNGFEIIVNSFSKPSIAFSPNVIAGSRISYAPTNWLRTSLLSKYVGLQYLDNTENEARSIPAYFLSDFRLVFTPTLKRIKNFQLMLNVNNLFDAEFSSNGYTYSYIFGDPVTENFYYPQAGRHFMAGLLIGF